MGRELSCLPAPGMPSSPSLSPGAVLLSPQELTSLPRPLAPWDCTMDGERGLFFKLRSRLSGDGDPPSSHKSGCPWGHVSGSESGEKLPFALTWTGGRFLVWSQRCPQICFPSPRQEDTVSVWTQQEGPGQTVLSPPLLSPIPHPLSHNFS